MTTSPDTSSTDSKKPLSLGLADIFKVGIGPSSSHTIGPMKASGFFLADIQQNIQQINRLRVTLYGSLAWTGKGHATDRAVVLGLAGQKPETIDPDKAEVLYAAICSDKRLFLTPDKAVVFDPVVDVVFDMKNVHPRHTNAMLFEAMEASGAVIAKQLWFSTGGGFVVRDGDTEDKSSSITLPFSYTNAGELLDLAQTNGKSLAFVARENETAFRTPQETDDLVDRLGEIMLACVARGLCQSGELAGGMRVKRRAKDIFDKLSCLPEKERLLGNVPLNFVSAYAMAVGEENASAGRIVTAPTNGASGVVPAVLRYYLEFCPNPTRDGQRDFLLVAAQFGALIKYNASISGAEVGCQGEIGAASSMAAAGLAAALGATNEQIENAAEIALEHHLGLTCDPINGLVQVPCIERNAFGAIKAITATTLAMLGDGTHFVSFDQVVETLRQTGKDMSAKYKETAQGGLALTACGFPSPRARS